MFFNISDVQVNQKQRTNEIDNIDQSIIQSHFTRKHSNHVPKLFKRRERSITNEIYSPENRIVRKDVRSESPTYLKRKFDSKLIA